MLSSLRGRGGCLSTQSTPLYLPLNAPSNDSQTFYLEGVKNQVFVYWSTLMRPETVVAQPFRITSEVKLNKGGHTYPNYPPFCFGRYLNEYFDLYLALYLELGVQILCT